MSFLGISALLAASTSFPGRSLSKYPSLFGEMGSTEGLVRQLQTSQEVVQHEKVLHPSLERPPFVLCLKAPEAPQQRLVDTSSESLRKSIAESLGLEASMVQGFAYFTWTRDLSSTGSVDAGVLDASEASSRRVFLFTIVEKCSTDISNTDCWEQQWMRWSAALVNETSPLNHAYAGHVNADISYLTPMFALNGL